MMQSKEKYEPLAVSMASSRVEKGYCSSGEETVWGVHVAGWAAGNPYGDKDE